MTTNVNVSDAQNYPATIVEQYIKLFSLIYMSNKACTINLEIFNQMIMERLTQRENLVIRLVFGLGFCCEECWKNGYIPKIGVDGNVKPNEKVIPSRVEPKEFFKAHSRNKVAEIFGVNPEAIRTAEKNAIKKLRHPGTLGLIKGEIVNDSLYVPEFGYIRKEKLKYPAYLYIKYQTDFKHLVEKLEMLNVDVHIPLARKTEKSTDRLVCDVFNPKLTKALEDSGCYLLSNLAKLSGYELLCIKGVGNSYYNQIIGTLKENDFEFF